MIELKERNLEMWRLRMEEDLTYTDIGKKFGISRGRVASIVEREQQRFMREEWAETCRANSEAMIRIYQELIAEQEDAHLNRASASAALFSLLFPDEEMPVTVIQETKVVP